MTEEEKKAIDLLKFYEGFFKNIGHEEEVKSIESIINYIEKLQKENEELKKGSDINVGSIPKDQIREKIENYQNEIECENSYLEQGIICEEEYKDRVKVYNSYIFILNKLLEEG